MKNKKSISVSLVVCCICIVLGIALIVATNISSSSYESKYLENSSRIGDLQTAYNEAKATVDDMDTVVEVEVNLKSCADVGQEVADLQTKYQTLSGEDVRDNALELDKYFAEDSKNSRVSWFTVPDSVGAVYTWEFQSTYGFASKEVDVLWLCRETDSGNLLAYSTGVYDTEQGVFSDIVYRMTTLGEEYTYANPKPGHGTSDTATETDVTTSPTESTADTSPIDSTISTTETSSDDTGVTGGAAPAHGGN